MTKEELIARNEKQIQDLVEFFEKLSPPNDEEAFLIMQGLKEEGRWHEGGTARKVAERQIELWKASKVQ